MTSTRVLTYAPSIFRMAGADKSGALGQAVSHATNLVMTLVAMALIDRVVWQGTAGRLGHLRHVPRAGAQTVAPEMSTAEVRSVLLPWCCAPIPSTFFACLAECSDRLGRRVWRPAAGLESCPTEL